MAFTATPVDGSVAPIPMSSAVPDGTNTPLAIEGGPSIATGGNTLVPVSMWVKDGNDVTLGAQADASASTDSGTFSYMALFKRLLAKFPAIGAQTTVNSSAVNIASDQIVPVKGNFTEVAGVTTISASASSTGAGTVAAADFIVQLDVSAYKFLALQLSGTWAGTFTFQCSNDNATWVSCDLTSPVPSNVGLSFQTTINGMFLGPVCFRYFRVRCTAYTSNTSLGGVLELYTQAPPGLNTFAQITGIATVQPGNTQNTTPWLMAGPNANGTQAANSAANTVIKGSAGWFYHAIITTLCTAGLTIYDNATTNSGTPLLVIPASAAVGTIYSFPSGARAVNGITSAGVTNCPAVTFHYT